MFCPVCLGHASAMHEACLGYAWAMPGPCLGYAWAMPKLCLGHALAMPGPCLSYAWAMLLLMPVVLEILNESTSQPGAQPLDHEPPNLDEPALKILRVEQTVEEKFENLQKKFDDQALELKKVEYQVSHWQAKYSEVNEALTFILGRSQKRSFLPTEDYITLNLLRDRLPDNLLWIIDFLKRVYSDFKNILSSIM